MATNSRQELHEAIDRLSEEEARRLSAALRAIDIGEASSRPRPLTEADVILREPLLADDETADEMIATVRRWRRESGYA